MPLTYDDAPADLVKLVGKRIDACYRALKDAEVTITCMLCRGGLKRHGHACRATVKVNSLKDRAEGKSDVTITFDGDTWQDWPEKELTATVDGALEGLEVQKDDEGHVKEDDLGRPRLRCKLHDIYVAGFAAVIERHGEAAPEAQALHDGLRYVQGLFNW